MVRRGFRVLSPVGFRIQKASALAERPTDLRNRRLVVLDNDPESISPMNLVPNYLLGFLMRDLQIKYGLKDTRWIRKPVASLASPDVLDEIVRDADIVLNGTAK